MRVQRLSSKDKAEAVTVLATAFHDYPVMRFVLRTRGQEYKRSLIALIDFFCELRLIHDWPVLGIHESGSLVAVALIDNPVLNPLPLPRKQIRELRSVIGSEAYERLATYEQETSNGEPADPHHFIGMIGVHPEHRGKGFAGHLLRAVEELSASDPGSIGVCLSTEDPRNLPFYERFGYHVISEVDIEELHSWCMFLSAK